MELKAVKPWFEAKIDIDVTNPFNGIERGCGLHSLSHLNSIRESIQWN